MGATPNSFGKAVPLPHSRWLQTERYVVSVIALLSKGDGVVVMSE
jgi:hypothetical protein